MASVHSCRLHRLCTPFYFYLGRDYNWFNIDLSSCKKKQCLTPAVGNLLLSEATESLPRSRFGINALLIIDTVETNDCLCASSHSSVCVRTGCVVCVPPCLKCRKQDRLSHLRVCIRKSHRFEHRSSLYPLLILTFLCCVILDVLVAVLYPTLPYDSQPNRQDGIQDIDTFDTLGSRRPTALRIQSRLQDGGSIVITSNEG
jgi:hypothetical protein